MSVSRWTGPRGQTESAIEHEHEEVLLVPRWVDCEQVTFKYGLGDEFIEVLKTLRKLGLDSKEPIRVKGIDVVPRDVVVAALPDPATLGERMHGKTCAGTLVTGTGKDGNPRKTYLYHVVDNEETMREYQSQAVVRQTALNPVIALELLAEGTWKGAGVLGPERFLPSRSSRSSRTTARHTVSSSSIPDALPISASRPHDSGVGVFVGRAHELAVLAEVTKAASVGVAAALVSGEPGSGKSRLLAEARRATDLTHIDVIGFEPERRVPLAAAAELLRKLTEVPEHGPRLDALLLHSDAAYALEPVRIFEAAHRALRAVEPVLLAIDDLQWMDDLSFALCHYLIRASRESDQQLAIFASTRPGERGAELVDLLPSERVSRIELTPLTLDEAIELAHAIDSGISPTRAKELWEQTKGSPFWLEALVRAGGKSGGVADFLTVRMRAATSDASALLALLAVVGRPTLSTVLTGVLEWPERRVEVALAELVTRGLAVEVGGAVRLTHDLIRDAAFADLSEEAQRVLHRRLADQLESDAGGDLRLLREALEHRRSAAVPTLDLALSLASSPRRTLLGHEGAQQLAAVADEGDPSDARLLELNERVASLASDVGNHALAFERWMLLAERTADRAARARLLFEASKAAWATEQLADARSLLDEARMTAGSGDSLSLAFDAHETALLLWGERRMAEGRTLAARTAERARRRAHSVGGVDRLDLEARRTHCDALRAEYWAAMQLDRRDEMLRSADEATNASRGLDERLHLESVLDAAFALMITDRPREAEARARAAWEESRRLVLPAVTVRAGLSLAETLVQLGRFDEASAVATQAMELSSRVDEVLHLAPRPFRVLDDIALHQGDWRQALRPFERFADEEASTHAGIKYHGLVAWWLARMGGETFEKDAVARLERARADAATTGCLRCSADLRLVGADALARVGRLEDAQSLLNEWDASHEQASFPRRRVGASVAARKGDPEGSKLLESAVVEAARRGLSLEEVWARLDLAEAVLGNDRERAVQELRVAADHAVANGSRAQLGLAEQALRSLGVRTWRRGSTGLPLTKREEEVAQLVTGGATNRDIATALFLSPKTVERHVSNVLRKVGARNRTELASRLRDRADEYAGNSR